jgi:sulfite exporter TauE/SafE
LAHLDEIYVTSVYLIPWITFLVALGGSAHCVGMCGGLVMAFTNNKKTNVSYQIGRLIGYMMIGGLVSLLGETIRDTFQSSELTLITTVFMGALLIFWGTKILFKKSIKLQLPSIFGKFSKKFYSLAHGKKIKSEILKSGIIGYLSIFLPCGFLYGVVLVIASFNSPLLGMAAMFTFWLGTVPAISFAPEILKKILIPIKNKAPILSSFALIFLGLVTISTRAYTYYTTGSCH